MNVLFTGLFPKWQCHFIAECNFIEEHLSAGDKITVLNCDASLEACDANPGRALPHCLVCMGMRQSAVGLLSSPVQALPLVHPDVESRLKSFAYPEFASLKQLREFSWEGVQVGEDVISSLVNATGSPFFDPSQHRELVRLAIQDFAATYLTALHHLKESGFDLVYVFNGRFVPARAWIRACEQTRTDYITQERIGMPDRVLRIRNGSVHETLRYGPLINEFWEKGRNDPDVLREARDFFEERPQGRLTGWHSYIKSQDSSSLPENWDSNKRNIVIYSSTESEFAGVSEYFEGAVFKDQKEAYAKLAAAVGKVTPDIHFYLRVHPNSCQEKIRWWEDPDLQSIRNLTVISPESPVSSYELLARCEKAIVFMTTMGVEATYWGKPCIVLANAMYCGTGAAYEPSTPEELLDLVMASGLTAKPREKALALGAFMRRGLPKLPFSEALDHCKLLFKGSRPDADPEILKSLWNWDHVVSKAGLPSWGKRLWQNWEWHRLHFRLKGRFAGPKGKTGG